MDHGLQHVATWRRPVIRPLPTSCPRIGGTLIARIVGVGLLLFVASRADATPIQWLWSGPVTGYQCMFGEPCTNDLNTVVPLGTTVNLSLSFNFDPLGPALPNPGPFPPPCLKGTASVGLQVAGQSYTSTGFVWEEAHGFGPGTCVPGYNFVEVVVPGWASDGPALSGSWIPFPASGLDGFWWGGHLIDGQPNSISTQFPAFYRPLQSNPQRFIAKLQAVQDPSLVPVPEPATWFLLSTGLSAIAGRRMFKRRR